MLSLSLAFLSRVDQKDSSHDSHRLTHHRTDLFDPSVAPVLSSSPVLARTLGPHWSAECTTYFSALTPYPITQSDTPRRDATRRYRIGNDAMRLLAFRLFSDPTQPRPARLPLTAAKSLPTLPITQRDRMRKRELTVPHYYYHYRVCRSCLSFIAFPSLFLDLIHDTYDTVHRASTRGNRCRDNAFTTSATPAHRRSR